MEELVPDDGDERIPNDALTSGQLVPNPSIDGSWHGINPQAHQRNEVDNLSCISRSSHEMQWTTRPQLLTKR